jgi:DNA polymerase III epsilon subunit-like protein
MAKPASYAEQHWNKNMMCAMDTETTGLKPGFHEIIQFACVPLNYDYTPLTGVLPFDTLIRPNFPERIDKQALEVNGLTLEKIMDVGFSSDKVIDLFEEWFTKLPILPNKYGSPNRIMPLGHNYAFDKAFLIEFFGPLNYDRYFHYHFRDSMVAALFINDREGVRNNQIPYPKVNLKYLATTLGVPLGRSHTALDDAACSAACYKKLLMSGSML